MSKARAFSNNDVSFIAWEYEEKIPDCLRFAIYRTNLNSNNREILPAWVGFLGQSNKEWKLQTTETWLIQKFSWRDLTPKRGGSSEYEIAPMVGKVGSLQPVKGLALGYSIYPKASSYWGGQWFRVKNKSRYSAKVWLYTRVKW